MKAAQTGEFVEVSEMLSPLKIGTILMETDTFIPDSVWVQKESFCPGWQAITNLNGDDLDGQIRRDGWNFMFVGGALQGTSWGLLSYVAIRCAALRIFKSMNITMHNYIHMYVIHYMRSYGV